jgi:hypothetical protein
MPTVSVFTLRTAAASCTMALAVLLGCFNAAEAQDRFVVGEPTQDVSRPDQSIYNGTSQAPTLICVPNQTIGPAGPDATPRTNNVTNAATPSGQAPSLFGDQCQTIGPPSRDATVIRGVNNAKLQLRNTSAFYADPVLVDSGSNTIQGVNSTGTVRVMTDYMLGAEDPWLQIYPWIGVLFSALAVRVGFHRIDRGMRDGRFIIVLGCLIGGSGAITLRALAYCAALNHHIVIH